MCRAAFDFYNNSLLLSCTILIKYNDLNIDMLKMATVIFLVKVQFFYKIIESRVARPELQYCLSRIKFLDHFYIVYLSNYPKKRNQGTETGAER